eukprot:TRINITY_DN10464_c0_g1_i1.p1 TRINITY_DN10464_c0_g1~~TRINITY_DN10464_c0_g1_i1.p1  ORF type:complete len:519 (-),score=82.90 TRINITY_DN10464_c0_g1_i1:55-1611(-)
MDLKRRLEITSVVEPGVDEDQMGLPSVDNYFVDEPLVLPNSQENTKAPKAFVHKLYEILSDPANNPTISWTAEGTSFVVLDPDTFAGDQLPKYYKHSNFSSFVRQLNLYNFKKLGKPNYWEFKHPHFLRGHPELLQQMKRKQAAPQTERSVKDEIQGLVRDKDRVVKDLSNVDKTQRSMQQILERLQGENQDLWRELTTTRREASAATETLQRVTRFLMQLMSNNSNPLLMGPDGNPAKRPRLAIETLASSPQVAMPFSIDEFTSPPPAIPSTPPMAIPPPEPVVDADFEQWITTFLHSEENRLATPTSPFPAVSAAPFAMPNGTITTTNDTLVNSPVQSPAVAPLFGDTGAIPPLPDDFLDPSIASTAVPTVTSDALTQIATSFPLIGSPPGKSVSAPNLFAVGSSALAVPQARALMNGTGAAVTTMEIPSTGSEPEMQRVQNVIGQLVSAVVRISKKYGYHNLLSNSGFGAWFNPASLKDDGREPLAILVFPNKETGDAHQLPESTDAVASDEMPL